MENHSSGGVGTGTVLEYPSEASISAAEEPQHAQHSQQAQQAQHSQQAQTASTSNHEPGATLSLFCKCACASFDSRPQHCKSLSIFISPGNFKCPVRQHGVSVPYSYGTDLEFKTSGIGSSMAAELTTGELTSFPLWVLPLRVYIYRSVMKSF